jgi:hypothetical protein
VTAPVRWRETPPSLAIPGWQGYTRDPSSPSLLTSPPPRVSNLATVSTLLEIRDDDANQIHRYTISAQMLLF